MIVLNEEINSSYVKDDISGIVEFGLNVKDILRIKALKFRNVYTSVQVSSRISNVDDGSIFSKFIDRLSLEKVVVKLDMIRPAGTHAYEIKTSEGLWVYPIWEKYV